MRKKQFILLTILALLMGSAQLNETRAQVFIMEEDDYAAPRAANTQPFPIPDVPWEHDSTHDFTPLGSGIWVLGALGAAYLYGKRKEDKE